MGDLIPYRRSSMSVIVARGDISSPIEDRQLNAIRGWFKKTYCFLRYSVLGQTSGSVCTNSIAATNGISKVTPIIDDYHG